MSHSYVVSIWIFLHGSTVYSWWLCDISTAWIHSVWLVAMTYVYDVICPWSEYGNAYLRTSMIFCRCLGVRGFPIRCAPGFRHTHASYKFYRLSLVPTLILWGEFYYPWFWSSWWCIDDGVLRLFIRTFSWEKLLSSLSKNLIFEEGSQDASIFAYENA